MAPKPRPSRASTTSRHAQLAAQGWHWPAPGTCCWPTNEGRPWSFCGAPAATPTYCAEHDALSRGRLPARRGLGAIAAQDFTLPTMTGNRATTQTRAILNGAKSAQARAARLKS